jgi:NhaP-type Na+/H+ or K+/H+ antiporter
MTFTRPFTLVDEEKKTVNYLKQFYEKTWDSYLKSVKESECSSTDTSRRLEGTRNATAADPAEVQQVTWALAHGLLKNGGPQELEKAFGGPQAVTLSNEHLEQLVDDSKLPFADQNLMFSFVFVPLAKVASEACAVDCSIYSTEHIPQCASGRYERRQEWAGCKCGGADQCVVNTTALKTFDNADGKSWYKALLSEYLFDTKCSTYSSSSRCNDDSKCKWQPAERGTEALKDVVCCKHDGSTSAVCPNATSSEETKSLGALTQTVKAKSAFMKTTDFLTLTSHTGEDAAEEIDMLVESAAPEGLGDDVQTQFGLQSLSNHLVAFVKAGAADATGHSWSKMEDNNICQQYQGNHCCPALDKDIRLSSTLGQPTKNTFEQSIRKSELMFEHCQKSCVESIERVFCAGMCDPNQADFLKFDPTKYAYGQGATLRLSNELCSTVFQACQDAKDLHGRVYRYKYKNEAKDDSKHRMAYSIFMSEELELYFVNQYSQTGVSLKMNIECVDSSTGNSSSMLTEKYLNGMEDESAPHLLDHPFEFKQYCTKAYAHDAIMLTVFLIMLIVGMHFANFLVQHHILWFPESGVYILVGMFVAAVLLAKDAKEAPSLLNLDAELLNLLLLPPIIFEAGYELKSQLHLFHKNLVAILCFAILGTLISTLIVGLSLSAIFAEISTLEALMFGSLISAVDPVATLATFAHVHVNPNLETIVFGESLVNDAMAIVLYRTFKVALEKQIQDGKAVSMLAMSEFFSTCFGSGFIGVMLGCCTMVYFRYVSFKGNTDTQALVLIFAAYCSFLISEACHFSGILATLVCGVWCAVFTDRNLSDVGDAKTHTLSKQFASLAEMTLFVLAGMMTCLFTVSRLQVQSVYT